MELSGSSRWGEDTEDKPREACGIFGVWGPGEDVAKLTYFGLYALQHRGQESAGIAYAVNDTVKCYKKMGLVNQVFNEELLSMMTGHAAIGHVRYSTTGSSVSINAQPILCLSNKRRLAIAHNGNLVNAGELERRLSAQTKNGKSCTSDSAIIAELVAEHPDPSFESALIDVLDKLKGAFSLAILTPDRLYAARDPLGIRPLCIGRINGKVWIVASETCALNIVGADFIRELDPGEVVAIDDEGQRVIHRMEGFRTALCSFEKIYFARPDSYLNEEILYDTRKKMGAILWREAPVEADMVAPVPDSAAPAAIGLAKESGIPYEECLIKNRYVGRTFIIPDQRLRDVGIGIKLNPLRNVVKGKRLLLVDDSIVRGTTSSQIIRMLYEAGAKEIHVRVSSPPVKFPCYYGIDMATREELLAHSRSMEEVRRFLRPDSLYYLSIEGMLEAFGLDREKHCLACFDGQYPISIPLQLQFDAKSLFEKRERRPSYDTDEEDFQNHLHSEETDKAPAVD